LIHSIRPNLSPCSWANLHSPCTFASESEKRAGRRDRVPAHKGRLAPPELPSIEARPPTAAYSGPVELQAAGPVQPRAVTYSAAPVRADSGYRRLLLGNSKAGLMQPLLEPRGAGDGYHFG
jgi:hypothetical protein